MLARELISGGPYAKPVVSAGSHMQNPQSQRGSICRTCRVSGGPSLASHQGPICRTSGVSRGPSLASLSPKKKTYLLQKTVFELKRCSNVLIISARCLHSCNRCSLFSVILMGRPKSMSPGIIVPPCPPSRRSWLYGPVIGRFDFVAQPIQIPG